MTAKVAAPDKSAAQTETQNIIRKQTDWEDTSTLTPTESVSSGNNRQVDEKHTAVYISERRCSSDSRSTNPCFSWVCPTGTSPRQSEDTDDSDRSGSIYRVPSKGSSCFQEASPDGGLYAWLTVAGSFFTVTAGFGLINSVGIVQSYLEMHQLRAFEDRDVAWIPALNVFLCLFLGIQVGPMFDRYGPRWIMASGSVVYTAGLIGLSFLGCEHDGKGHVHHDEGIRDGRRYGLLMLAWGLLCGTGAACVCTTAMAVLSHWFDRRRGLANGIVFVGSSLGGSLFPLLLRATLDSLGWSTTMRFCALIVAVLLGLGNLLIRGRLEGKKGPGTVNLRCFLDWRFVWTTAAIACECYPFFCSRLVM